jgi:hypothetical protein
MNYTAWIRKGLGKPGKSQKGLAASLGVVPSVVSKMLNGRRKLKADEVAVVAAYLEIDPPNSPREHLRTKFAVRTIPLRARLEVGVWRRIGRGVMDTTLIPASPDPRVANFEQYSVALDGVEYAGMPGRYAICVPYGDLRQTPRDGDLLHVVVKNGDLQQELLLIAKDGKLTLPDPHSALIPPVGIYEPAITIEGLVVGFYQSTSF